MFNTFNYGSALFNSGIAYHWDRKIFRDNLPWSAFAGDYILGRCWKIGLRSSFKCRRYKCRR